MENNRNVGNGSKVKRGQGEEGGGMERRVAGRE